MISVEVEDVTYFKNQEILVTTRKSALKKFMKAKSLFLLDLELISFKEVLENSLKSKMFYQ